MSGIGHVRDRSYPSPGRRRCAGLAAVLALGAGLLALTAPVAAQQYTIPDIRIEASVRDDGTVRIVEHRSYVFDGAFSWADYRLPKAGFSAIREIGVAEGGEAFVNADTEQPGTFRVAESRDAFNVRWHYSAEDERRTFTLTYTLEGAIVRGPDWSEFFWAYVGAGRERSTERLAISIALPEAVPPESLHAWARGPRSRIAISTEPGRYDVTAARIDRSTAVAIRTVFPSTVFAGAGATIADPDFSLAAAQADEASQAARAAQRSERRSQLAGIGVELAFLWGVLSLGGFAYFYSKYGRRPPVTELNAEHGGLVVPGALEPALIGWLLAGRQTTGGHVMATLLDLARRGYFEITEQPAATGLFASRKPRFRITSTGKPPESGLLDWEASLLEFVRGRLGAGESRLDALFKHESRAVRKWFSSWKREVEADARGRGWVDGDSYRGALLNAALQVLVLVAAVVSIVLTAAPQLAIPILLALVMALLSIVIVRLTAEGRTLYRRWKAYKKALDDAGRHRAGEELDRHFIYAVAFGVRKRGIQGLFETHADSAATMSWIVLMNPSASSTALAETFTTLNATGTAVFAGAAGVAGGGGASAGAAGGGAGGGAG